MEKKHEDILDINQEILYESNQFNLTNITKKVKSQQENNNTLVNDPQPIQQDDTTHQNH